MWVRALNGVVLEVSDIIAADLVEQGHKSFLTEAEARGLPEPRKAPAKRKTQG